MGWLLIICTAGLCHFDRLLYWAPWATGNAPALNGNFQYGILSEESRSSGIHKERAVYKLVVMKFLHSMVIKALGYC